MAKKIRLRAKVSRGVTLVEAIIYHPMETGFRLDPDSSQLVPAHYIKQVVIRHQRNIVLTCDFSRAVAKNPYLAFKFNGGNKGETLTLTWWDNKQESASVTATIA